MIVNGELETIRKEAVMTYFNILSQHLLGGTEENLSQASSCFVQILNLNFQNKNKNAFITSHYTKFHVLSYSDFSVFDIHT
jgi:hypothetical protein